MLKKDDILNSYFDSRSQIDIIFSTLVAVDEELMKLYQIQSKTELESVVSKIELIMDNLTSQAGRYKNEYMHYKIQKIKDLCKELKTN